MNKDLITAIKKFNGYKILLTRSSAKTQNKKTQALKISSLFDKKIITKEKAEFILPRIKGRYLVTDKNKFNKVAIIDDKANKIESLTPKKRWLKIINPTEFIFL